MQHQSGTVRGRYSDLGRVWAPAPMRVMSRLRRASVSLTVRAVSPRPSFDKILACSRACTFVPCKPTGSQNLRPAESENR